MFPNIGRCSLDLFIQQADARGQVHGEVWVGNVDMHRACHIISDERTSQARMFSPGAPGKRNSQAWPGACSRNTARVIALRKCVYTRADALVNHTACCERASTTSFHQLT